MSEKIEATGQIYIEASTGEYGRVFPAPAVPERQLHPAMQVLWVPFKPGVRPQLWIKGEFTKYFLPENWKDRK